MFDKCKIGWKNSGWEEDPTISICQLQSSPRAHILKVCRLRQLHFLSSRNWHWYAEFLLGGCCCLKQALWLGLHCPQSMKTLLKKMNSEQEKVRWFSDFFGLPAQSQRSLLEPWVNIAWVWVSWVMWPCYLINPYKVLRVRWWVSPRA